MKRCYGLSLTLSAVTLPSLYNEAAAKGFHKTALGLSVLLGVVVCLLHDYFKETK